MKDYCYTFDGLECTLTTEQPEIACDGDWYEDLKKAGYRSRYRFGRESDEVEIELMESKREDEFRWFISVMLGSEGFMDVYCSNAWLVWKFIRDWALPLLEFQQGGPLKDFCTRGQEILFDGRDGIPAAQRLVAREERERRYYRKLREKNEAKANI